MRRDRSRRRRPAALRAAILALPPLLLLNIQTTSAGHNDPPLPETPEANPPPSTSAVDDDDASKSLHGCRVPSSSYGDARLEGVQTFAPLIAVICPGDAECKSSSEQWSSIAVEKSSDFVSSEEDCRILCEETKGCDVYTYWPHGLGVPEQPICEICPRDEGAILKPEESYCDETGCGKNCGEAFGYFASEGTDDFDVACAGLVSWFRYATKCCEYAEGHAPGEAGACELFGSTVAETNDGTVATGRALAYGIGDTVTAPVDCATTRWLPFLEPLPVTPTLTKKAELLEGPIREDDLDEFGIELDDLDCQDRWCDDVYGGDCCANPYPNEEWDEAQICTEGIVVMLDSDDEAEDVSCEYTCCNGLEDYLDEDEDTDAPTQAPTESPPEADDGRLCWIPSHRYGVASAGSCFEASLLAVSAPKATLDLGTKQGWWTDNGSFELIPREDDENVIDRGPAGCMNACMNWDGCGGWEFYKQSSACLLKSGPEQGCSPMLGRSSLEHSGSDVVGGINGCVDVSDPQTKDALSTDDLWFLQCDVPRCTEPHYRGAYVGDTFLPDPVDGEEACFYKQFSPEEMFSNGPDRWMVLTGGSNMLSMYTQLVNIFAPPGDGERPLIAFEDTLNYNIIDVVFRREDLPIDPLMTEDDLPDGIIHLSKNRFCDLDPALDCGDNLGDLPPWTDPYLRALQSAFSDAPYEPGATRVTLVVGQLWSNAEVVLKAFPAASDSGWASPSISVTFLGQSMVWYPCHLQKWCDQPALGSTTQAMLQRFRSDIESMLQTGDMACGSDHYDCFFATHGYQYGADYAGRQMISILEELTGNRDWARFVDLNNGILREGELIDGHTTPAGGTHTLFQMIWNTVLEAPETGCPEAAALTPSCFADCEGKGGKEECACDPVEDKDWMCHNERRCEFDLFQPVPWEIITAVPPRHREDDSIVSTCFDLDKIDSFRRHLSATNDPQSDCDRIWCGSAAAGRALAALTFLLGGALIVWSNAEYRLAFQERYRIAKAAIFRLCSRIRFRISNQKNEGKEAGDFDDTGTNPDGDSTLKGDVGSLDVYSAKGVLDSPSRLSRVQTNGTEWSKAVNNNDSPSRLSHAKSIERAYDTEAEVQPEDIKSIFFDSNKALQSPTRMHGTTSCSKGPYTAADSPGRLSHGTADTTWVDDMEANLHHEGGKDDGCSLSFNDEPNRHVTGETRPSTSHKEHLKSLGMARLLASIHIVLGHLYAKGVVHDVYFFQWGFTWVPWFFMLSGYVLTHARIHSSDPSKVETPLNHVAKRLSTIFPVYALGVVLTMLIRIAKDKKLPSAGILVAQSFLLQSWVPLWTEQALVSQCWFLSNLIVYWLGFGWVYKRLRTLSLRWTVAGLLFISILPWFIVIVPAADDDISSTWYSEHKWGQTDEPVDIWTVMLKFHPIFYIHVFLFGMLLAVLRSHVKREVETATRDTAAPLQLPKLISWIRQISRYGATIGCLGLVLVFSIKDLQPTAYKLSARLTVLLPLQGVMMLGLSPLPCDADEKRILSLDPLAWLFSYAPSWIGDVSYCQYVLQFIMYDLFPVAYISNASFFFYLLGASMLTYQLVHTPAANAWRNTLKNRKKYGVIFLLIVPASLLATTLGIAKATYQPPSGSDSSVSGSEYDDGTGNSTNATDSPVTYEPSAPSVQIAPDAIDLELNWTLSSGRRLKSDDERVLINPSILFRDDGAGGIEWVRSGRLHAVTEVLSDGMYNGKPVTERLLTFQSSIVLAVEPFDGDLSAGFNNVADWGLDGVSPLQSLDPYLASHLGKNEYWTKLCEGKPTLDEENKILNRMQVTGPEDPKLVDLGHLSGDPKWGVSFSSYPPPVLLSEDSQEDCQWENRAVMQMYLAPNGPQLAAGQQSPGVKLACGDSDGHEKNWIAFTYEGRLYYIHSVEPHTIMQVRESDGTCVEQHKTSSAQLDALSKRVTAVRGSATAIRYSEEEFLALLHTYRSGRGYQTMAYTFEAKPPFRVRRLSVPLELQGGGRAFASSLATQSDKVLIGYGEADRKARVLVMTREHLESKFDWCNE